MNPTQLPPSARLKLDLMFHGIHYTEALGQAAGHAFPNYYPYRFQPGEHDPTGKGKAPIPYALSLADGTVIRIKGSGDSPWGVSGDRTSGYRLGQVGQPDIPVEFVPLPRWMGAQTSDGFAMARTGLELLGDLGVINLAPGCEYFLHKQDGVSMRCGFCAYGAPDERVAHLGQKIHQVSLPDLTYTRIGETLEAALAEGGVRQLYLVGGSLTDWREEGQRYLEIARRIQAVNRHRLPLSCGSGALPLDIMRQLRDENLVDNVCFNLEIWSEPLFAKICPGKHRYVGYARWIEALEQAVGLWGRGHVYTAMVAGIELEPEHGMSWEQAADLALEGAEALCARGILPVYSLYWPVGGRDHPEYMSRLRNYFERLNLGYHGLRRKYDLHISDSFMTHRCAFMQMECDLDRLMAD
ncbi:MAG: radical SAM protein [Thiobacillaceae bacterium]|jgi:hypothetical protein|nr:radical SAM protein [Thiobacillaceae bacterium]